GKCFAMKDLGEAAFILGIKIYKDRSKQLIGLGQNAYIDKILKRYKIDNSKRGNIPMQERIDLNKTQGASTPKEVKRMQNVPYASVVGSIMKEKGTNEATWRKFSLKELHAATNNFNYDNKLGEGGFGSCYWGQLWDRSQIAVKRLKVWRNKAEMEFAVEVEILARVRHKNLLSLRGYCAEGQERLIVYDYMANLSLLSSSFGSTKFFLIGQEE
ncbi:PTI1-like tyrosine-protein kinase, partial [Tanacetum coccineum]